MVIIEHNEQIALNKILHQHLDLIKDNRGKIRTSRRLMAAMDAVQGFCKVPTENFSERCNPGLQQQLSDCEYELIVTEELTNTLLEKVRIVL